MPATVQLTIWPARRPATPPDRIHDSRALTYRACEASRMRGMQRRPSLECAYSLRAHTGEVGARAHRARQIGRLCQRG